MYKTRKLFGAAAFAGMLAAGGAAFTASNSLPSPTVTKGYGAQSISGVTAESIVYDTNLSKDTITSVRLVLTGDTTEKTIQIAFNDAAPATCSDAGTFDLTPETPRVEPDAVVAGCSSRELERADRYCTFIAFEPGRLLYRRGERPDTLIILISGQAMALTGGPNVQMIGHGECIGALAASASGGRVPDAAIALTAGTSATLTARELDGLIQACPPSLNAFGAIRCEPGPCDET
jgi:hypothetical protein